MAAWEQTAALGRTVDTGNPMYGEATGEAPAVMPDILTESGKQGLKPVDMDVGFDIPMDLDVTAAAAPSMDFDVSAYTSMPAMDMDVTGVHEPAHEPLLPDFDVTGGQQLPVGGQSMDFDVTGSHPNVAGTSMDFDVTGSHPNVVGSTSMDFDVTGSHPNVATGAPALETPMDFSAPMDFGASPAPAVETAGGGMDFDFSAPAAPAFGGETEGAGSGMDFDLSASPAATALGTGMETSALEAPAFEMPSFETTSFETPSFETTSLETPSLETAGLETQAALETSGGLGMDFNISASPATAAPAPAAPAMETSAGFGGLDFDITGGNAPAAPEQPGADMSNVMSEPMFDVSSPAVAATPGAEPSAGLGGLDFDLTGSHPLVTSEAAIDTKSTVVLTAPMDFDISAPSPAAPSPVAAAAPGEGGMDFDLSASSSMVIPARGGELAGLGGMDFDVSSPQGMRAEPTVDLSRISLDLSSAEGAGVADTVVFGEEKKDERWEDVQNKLELAKAFLTGMGDVDTARELLGEVLNEGDAQQVESARSLIQQI